MRKNKGSIEIIFLLVILIVLLILTFCVYILYIQITTYIVPIKQDIFYIVQNAYFSLNNECLEYNDYEVDNNNLKSRVSEILLINYPESKLEKIYYNSQENTVDIEMSVVVEPMILKNYIGNIKLKIKDTIKLKMMEVKV